MNETNKNTRGRNVKRPVLLHTSDPDEYVPNCQQILENWI